LEGYNWTIIQPAELSAAAILVSYWTDINGSAWIALLLVTVVGINMMGARGVSDRLSAVYRPTALG
jgi:amino acid transporter